MNGSRHEQSPREFVTAQSCPAEKFPLISPRPSNKKNVNGMKDVLIVYASKYGATKGIAEKTAEVIRNEGLEVDLAEAGEIVNPDPYRAILVGSAVYIGKWQKKAVQFVKKHESVLAGKKTWFFSSGPTGEGDPAGILQGWKCPQALKEVSERIGPVGIALFHGAVDMDKLSGLHRFMVKKINAPTGDFRNWQQISEWAEGIAAELKKTS
jgi:menaquinone-dependent protoporphyrinogen oxidase